MDQYKLITKKEKPSEFNNFLDNLKKYDNKKIYKGYNNPLITVSHSIDSDINIFELILNDGVNPNYMDKKYYNTALHYYLMKNKNDDPNIVHLFKKHGFNFNNFNNEGYTCLDYALMYKKFKCYNAIFTYYKTLDRYF